MLRIRFVLPAGVDAGQFSSWSLSVTSRNRRPEEVIMTEIAVA
jgi:hypothetical protein